MDCETFTFLSASKFHLIILKRDKILKKIKQKKNMNSQVMKDLLSEWEVMQQCKSVVYLQYAD